MHLCCYLLIQRFRIDQSDARKLSGLGYPDSCERGNKNHFVGGIKSQRRQPPSCEKEVRPAVRVAEVFAGLTCTALQVEHLAIDAKTKLGHSVRQLNHNGIWSECEDNVFVVSICDCCRSEVTISYG